MPYHSHYYSGATSVENGHIHGYEGETSYAPTGVTHIHYIEGITTYDDGHTHFYRITTGIDIPNSDGGHTHLINGVTEVANQHIHYISNYTSVS